MSFGSWLDDLMRKRQEKAYQRFYEHFNEEVGKGDLKVMQECEDEE